MLESNSVPVIWVTSRVYDIDLAYINLMNDMDEASLRRFTFKVRYDYLTAAQVTSAFVQFFGCQPQGTLGHLTCLTPGDFALVKIKADIMDITDPKELARQLEREQNAKPGSSVKGKPVGFGPG